MINISDILQLHYKTTEDWHKGKIENNYKGLLYIICEQHKQNFNLWHKEDITRSTTISDTEIANAKRSIDKLNQKRNDLIEQIDEEIINQLSNVKLLDNAVRYTEMPGSVIDRLSIMTLRIFHMNEQLSRKDISKEQYKIVKNKLAICQKQHSDLVESFTHLVNDIICGKAKLTSYKHMKMYNDKTLNPYLYKQNAVLIYHNLGLGDHIICQGLVREIYNDYNKIDLFCKPHNYNTVSTIYKDLINLNIIQADDSIASRYIKDNAHKYDKIIEVHQTNTIEPFDQQFYNIADISFKKRWESFKLPEDCYTVAKKVFTQTNLKHNEYIFIHDDNRRKIDDNKIESDKTIFRDSSISTYSITDYIEIIKNASEIHVIDSCFMLLIDSLDYSNKKQKLYRHRYARPDEEWLTPTVRKNWINIY